MKSPEVLRSVPSGRYLYDSGLSQDDPATELRALDLKPDDRLLCIAGAGELPLSILASEPLLIDAVDISLGQLQLSKLKLAAVRALDVEEAAQFLGYIPCDRGDRLRLLGMVDEYLDESGKSFWQDHLFVFKKGPIHYGRYERYLSQFRGTGLFLLGGKKKLYELFECGDRRSQEEYFDKTLRSALLEKLFRIIFFPGLLKRRGNREYYITQEGESNITQRFVDHFRSFCTGTPARENYFLQFLFLGNIIYYEALPAFLQERGIEVIRLHHNNIRYLHTSYSDILKKSIGGRYNKFALSNMGDWLGEDGFSELVRLIAEKSANNSKVLLRCTHVSYQVPEDLSKIVIPDRQSGEELRRFDRFPFYNLVPMDIRIRKEVFHDR